MIPYTEAAVDSKPEPPVSSTHQLPNGQVVETSSWNASTATSSKAKDSDVEDSEVTIAVMGATGSGKTTFINTASGSRLRIGRGLKSCTNIVQIAEPFELDGRSVTLIDTPGFDDTTKSDADILRMIAAFLATTYENGKRLSGILFIHRISDFRMGGISTRNFKMFRQLCGESTLQNVVIVTNMWGEVSLDLGEAREAELASQDMFFKPVLDKGGQMLRHDNNVESAHNVLRHIVENHPLSLQIQRELVDQKKDISQTAAGEELNRELMQQIQKHTEEMKLLEEEMREAIRMKDEETKRELEMATRKLQVEIDRVQNDAHNLVSEYTEEKKRLEEKMQELSDAARQKSEKARDDHNHQMSMLQTQLNQMSLDAASERAGLLRQLEQSRSRPRPGFLSMLGAALDSLF